MFWNGKFLFGSCLICSVVVLFGMYTQGLALILRCSRIDCVQFSSGDLSHSGTCKSRLQVGKIPAMDLASKKGKSLQQSWIRIHFRAGEHPLKEL